MKFTKTAFKSRTTFSETLEVCPGTFQMRKLPLFELVFTFKTGGSALFQGETMLCAARQMSLF